MATKKFLLEVEEGMTNCSECPEGLMVIVQEPNSVVGVWIAMNTTSQQ